MNIKMPWCCFAQATRVRAVLIACALLGACSDGNSGSGPAVATEMPTAAFFEQAGPYAFSEQNIQIPNTSGRGGAFIAGRRYVPDDPGLYPLLVFLPGFGATYENYAQYSQHFASHGVAVVAIAFASDGSVGFDGQHDLLLIQVADTLGYALASLADKVDPQSIAVMGHSLGAKMAFYTAAMFNGSDPAVPRVALAMGLDPVNSGGPPCFIAPVDCLRYPGAPNPLGADNQVPIIARRTELVWLQTQLEQVSGLDVFWQPEFLQDEIDQGLIVAVEVR